jgi:hypothetical protein
MNTRSAANVLVALGHPLDACLAFSLSSGPVSMTAGWQTFHSVLQQIAEAA